ncbi:MAG: glutamate racemase [Firmicutes bacterium]|nr:glutamate racemase [Bacillota bacterium]
MDNRPIGFFDSGLGGLTCIPYLTAALPEERIIYFGDTARTPYGSKAVSTIKNFSMQIADFLVKNDVKMIVIACNTVSSICLEDLRGRFPHIPIVGVIDPAAERVAKSCGNENRIGIIGTKVTIRSEAYNRIINEMRPELEVYAAPCPALVPLIEEGIIKNDIMDMTIKYYLDDFILENRLDTLVLGCTHYPLIRDSIERLYPDLRIINPSEEIIHSIRKILEERDMLAEGSMFENVFYASDLSENFINMIEKIFASSPMKVNFENLDIIDIDSIKNI